MREHISLTLVLPQVPVMPSENFPDGPLIAPRALLLPHDLILLVALPEDRDGAFLDRVGGEDGAVVSCPGESHKKPGHMLRA